MSLLRYTRQKLDAAIETIGELKRGEFPQQDSKDALEEIESLFKELREDLLAIRSDADPASVAAFCNAVLGELFTYLPVIGFLHRSRNPGNPFELYGPLRHLARALIGTDAKVVLSSEWDFSPYTLLKMPELPSYVLIGLPATEAGNALLAPLAGHEVGHSIWALEDGLNKYKAQVFEGIVQAVRADWKRLSEAYFPHLKGKDDADLAGDVLAVRRLAPALQWALRQCEEVFCDLVALRLFSEAYLHAFAYLLAPGLSSDPAERIRHYPTVRQRVEYMRRGAAVFGAKIPDGYEMLFDKDPATPDGVEDFLQVLQRLSDHATREQVDGLIEHVKGYVSARGVPPIYESAVQTVVRAFTLMVPADSPRVAEILVGGWRVALDSNLWPELTEEKRRVLLSELVLKSAEVLEFRNLKEGVQ